MWRNVACYWANHSGMFKAHIELIKSDRHILTTRKNMQVFIGMAGGEFRAKAITGLIAFEVLIVNQVARCNIRKISIDVFRSLLTPDTKALDQMVGGQTPFP
ncbi:Uncharacterised protein [Vibrio cholerae]|uniref:Uncharacterized protein n=1 Tax=Vibrio cholerae TaxID=666 RepID=A0A655WAI2_VIBCL|nr:Uncharacterised protein [Vibrio cholerae]CSB24588.1 Uncharacterised protein [Vibrio cholerae]CSB24856.1 Uncharacterised protein [Vibrio cholerae]CSB84689.1 Uncharacterised protein [Vibrio cholerae]CSB89128.1 Uncharacterised protein [Vibrio cholerae]